MWYFNDLFHYVVKPYARKFKKSRRVACNWGDQTCWCWTHSLSVSSSLQQDDSKLVVMAGEEDDWEEDWRRTGGGGGGGGSGSGVTHSC